MCIYIYTLYIYTYTLYIYTYIYIHIYQDVYACVTANSRRNKTHTCDQAPASRREILSTPAPTPTHARNHPHKLPPPPTHVHTHWHTRSLLHTFSGLFGFFWRHICHARLLQNFFVFAFGRLEHFIYFLDHECIAYICDMCVYRCAYIYIYICTYIHIHIYVYANLGISSIFATTSVLPVFRHVCVYVYIYIYTYISM